MSLWLELLFSDECAPAAAKKSLNMHTATSRTKPPSIVPNTSAAQACTRSSRRTGTRSSSSPPASRCCRSSSTAQPRGPSCASSGSTGARACLVGVGFRSFFCSPASVVHVGGPRRRLYQRREQRRLQHGTLLESMEFAQPSSSVPCLRLEDDFPWASCMSICLGNKLKVWVVFALSLQPISLLLCSAP